MSVNAWIQGITNQEVKSRIVEIRIRNVSVFYDTKRVKFYVISVWEAQNFKHSFFKTLSFLPYFMKKPKIYTDYVTFYAE